METDKMIVDRRGLAMVRQECQESGIEVKLVPGCWDGTGPSLAQIVFLSRIKAMYPESLLAVEVASDKVACLVQGLQKPISTASVRARRMAFLKCVDIVVYDEDYEMEGTPGLLTPDHCCTEWEIDSDKAILGYDSLALLRSLCSKRGFGITFIPGCWDGTGPHLGHAICLEHCKSRRYRSLLVAGVANDATVKALKGDGRPISSAGDRARMIAALRPVDIVVVNQETGDAGADGDEILRLLRPDSFIADKKDRSLLRKKTICHEMGIEFLPHSRFAPWNAPGISTSSYLEILKELEG